MASLTKERVTPGVTPLQTLYETRPVTLFVQVSKTKTKTKTKYLTHLPLLAAFKEVGVLSAADVTLYTRRSHTMPYKHFNEYDAPYLVKLIQRRRPTWNELGIIEALKKASAADMTLGQVTTAAENAALDKEAKTPAAILFDKYQQAATKAKLIAEKMLCVECTPARKHPVTEMTKMAHGWVCNEHQETA